MAQALRARLGPIITKVHNTVGPAYNATEKVVVEQYDKILKSGEQYVVKDPAEADKLLKKWFYTNLSRHGGTAQIVIAKLINTSQRNAQTIR